MFPVRHSTVVVHGGEQLVIRKLVIVGVLSTEKTYIECLSVAMEVSRWEGLVLYVFLVRRVNTIFRLLTSFFVFPFRLIYISWISYKPSLSSHRNYKL